MKQSLLLFIFLISIISQAEPISLVKDFKQTKDQYLSQEENQRKIVSALYTINKKIKRMLKEKTLILEEQAIISSQIETLKTQIQENENKKNEQKIVLKDRFKALYKMGGSGFLKVLFESKSSFELEKNLKVLTKIANRDLILIREYSEFLKIMEEKIANLQVRLSQLEKNEQKLKIKESQLLGQNESKEKILKLVKSTTESNLLKLKNLRSESGELDALFKPSFFEQKGFLPIPVNGKLLKDFGVQLLTQESKRFNFIHKGLFYGAPLGQPISSVFTGKVAFVGSLPGFGKTVIVDHGDHYYSIYGNQKKSIVSEGQEVLQNQLIGYVGNQMNSSGLYFEIRHFSEPSNPRQWLKGSFL
jgi:septal ring factor EnvC (AmiA/AmiB activator)